ncbi:hypothetical protein NFI96_024380 [Prochilodus magdalenae]|nr:hypothetical protein NFI96_024380 [Prochilodus magdalenae]
MSSESGGLDFGASLDLVCTYTRILEGFQAKGKRILKFFEEKPTNNEVAATAADIQRTAALPDSPRLIIQEFAGDKMNPEKWMQSVEGELVLGSSFFFFFEGLAALFAIFYILNLEYQEEAASTMEFIQRFGYKMGINPGTGSKVGARTLEKKRSGMNPHVCTLLRKLMDFE